MTTDESRTIYVLVHEGVLGGVDVVLREPPGATIPAGTTIHWIVVLYNRSIEGSPHLVFVRLKRNGTILGTNEYVLDPSAGIPFDFYDILPEGPQTYLFEAGFVEDGFYYVNETSPGDYIVGDVPELKIGE